jgi:hypothetical protein
MRIGKIAGDECKQTLATLSPDCPSALSEHALANHNNAWRWKQALL